MAIDGSNHSDQEKNTSYSSDLAKAQIMRLNRNFVITQSQFIQCLNVCLSRAELLLLIIGFLNTIHKNTELTAAIQNIQNELVNLNYDKAVDLLKDIFKQPDKYIENKDQKEWDDCIQCVTDLLSSEKKLKTEQIERDDDSSRRIFESIFSVRYLENIHIIEEMQKMWPDKQIGDMESMVKFISTTIFKTKSDFAWEYWDSHYDTRILLNNNRGLEVPKIETDTPQVRSPGILKSTTSRPMYMYDQDISFKGKASQSDKNKFVTNQNNSWPSKNYNIPLVASFSGHTVWYIGVLIDYCKSRPEKDRKHFVESMLRALLAVYISQGYHGYADIMYILNDSLILKSLEDIGAKIDPNALFSDMHVLYESVFSESIDYTTTTLLKRAAHYELMVKAIKDDKISAAEVVKKYPLNEDIILAAYEKTGKPDTLVNANIEVVASLVRKDKIKVEALQSLVKNNEPQLSHMFDIIIKHLPCFIKDAADFNNILGALHSNERNSVFDVMQEQLPKLIKSASDFNNVFQHLKATQKTTMLDALKEQLPNLIKSVNDFNNICANLNFEQSSLVDDLLKEQWPSLIKSVSDFDDLFSNLSEKKRPIVLDALKEHLPRIIKRMSDFQVVLKYKIVLQNTIILDALKEQLPKIIKNVSDFKNICLYLDFEKSKSVIDILKAQWPSLTKNHEDFNIVLNVILHHMIMEKKLKNVASFIKNETTLNNFSSQNNDFYSLMKSGKTYEFLNLICDYPATESKLTNLIKEARQFKPESIPLNKDNLLQLKKRASNESVEEPRDLPSK